MHSIIISQVGIATTSNVEFSETFVINPPCYVNSEKSLDPGRYNSDHLSYSDMCTYQSRRLETSYRDYF